MNMSDIEHVLWLTHSVKLTELGLPSSLPASTKEEDRAATLAKRAQHGDYDPGKGLSL